MSLDQVRSSFSAGPAVRHYTGAVKRVGLWESEKIFFATYFKRSDRILDLGCGAGRTTFGLWRGGYRNISGADLSAEMVRSARKTAEKARIPIGFVEADARSLPFGDKEFDSCVFSFNGLMQIPGRSDRVRAMKEVRRVLKPGGMFIFTTHDRERASEHRTFWKQEKERWSLGGQDPRFHEFGDMVFKFYTRETFLHIPDRREILSCLKAARFRHVEDRWMDDIAREPRRVRKFAVSCRFWAVRR
jgi:ubiquinone/menaquinone biosynthesis C-methylase UbiE